MPNIEEKLLQKIQSFKENDFTQKVLMPLYKSFDYEKVEFYGGSYENGKDLICWKRDQWQDIEMTVVQAKCYKPTGKAADKNSIGEMVVQICQAAETPVLYIDGNQYKPVTVTIVTPFIIDTRVLETAFFAYESAKKYKVKVIDGTYIVKILRTKLPKVVDVLIGSGPLINDIMARSLNNVDLRNALNVYKLKELNDVYCDLDFTVGNITSKLLLSFELKPKDVKTTHSEESWKTFKALHEELLREMKVDIFNEKIKDIESTYKRDARAVDKALQKYKAKKAKLDEIGIINIISNITEQANCEDNEDIQDAIANMVGVIFDYKKLDSRSLNDYIEFTNAIENEINELKKLRKNITNSKLHKYLEHYDNAITKYRHLEEELNELEHEIKVAKYHATINGENICNTIKQNQINLKKLITELLTNQRTPVKVLQFITHCQQILTSTEKLLRNDSLSEASGLSKDRRYVSIDKLDRINFSIHEIFDSGSDFVVFGEAGAGKSTTLQSYARKMIESNAKEVVLYIPLAKSFYRLDVNNATELDYVEYLHKAIVRHLLSQDITIDVSTIREFAKQRSSLFIFDGIDEVIDKVPWIINAITIFKQQNPKAQVITSSRLSGKYINKIPFVGLSLLPFDNEQRETFFKRWFKDTEKLVMVTKHLENTSELNEIVRNPLLATILCVIAEYDIPLPESEIRLYEERMGLLLGSYDQQKQSQRLKSHYRDLLRVSYKTAFILHLKEARYATKDAITNKLGDLYQSRISLNKISLAVEELIDPCNILIPMTDDGQYGFGHLRFQEYLAACEMKENRSIDLMGYLDKAFWRGAFVLLSKMSDDIYHVIDEVVETGQITRYIETIEAMLKVRPESEQFNLRIIIKRNFGKDSLTALFEY